MEHPIPSLSLLHKLEGGARNGCNAKLKDKTTLIRNINYVFLHYTTAIGVFKVNAKCSIDAAIKYSIEMKILYIHVDIDSLLDYFSLTIFIFM